jgi:membrane-associated phospholipid phosphatase
MHQLLESDRQLFKLINSTWHHPILDATMPLLRHQLLWTPFYLFMILYVLINYKKTGWWWVIFAACLATLTNFISSDLIKENIFRLRPCNDPSMANELRFLVSYRPKSSSFTSSHATNHFGLAAFLFYTLRKHIGNKAWVFFAWAGIIIYSQVYVGVHYPLDVIFGGLVGFLFGYLSARSFNKNYSLV